MNLFVVKSVHLLRDSWLLSITRWNDEEIDFVFWIDRDAVTCKLL